MFGKAMVCSLFAALLLPAANVAGAEQPPLRIAMTLADIPLTDGAPDQGTEGLRFLGYTVYDPLIRWDLSSADQPARLVPGLATSWKQDPEDPTRWIFELRQGVTFLDGSIFNADAVIWNLERALDDKSPQFSRSARALTNRLAVAYRRLPQARRLACRIADRRYRHGDAVDAQPVSDRQPGAVGKDRPRPPGISLQPVGHGSVAAQIHHPTAAGRTGPQ